MRLFIVLYQKTETHIGNNVSIGHNAIVYGCIISDNVLVGMGAIIMDNCKIGSNVIIYCWCSGIRAL